MEECRGLKRFSPEHLPGGAGVSHLPVSPGKHLELPIGRDRRRDGWRGGGPGNPQSMPALAPRKALMKRSVLFQSSSAIAYIGCLGIHVASSRRYVDDPHARAKANPHCSVPQKLCSPWRSSSGPTLSASTHLQGFLKHSALRLARPRCDGGSSSPSAVGRRRWTSPKRLSSTNGGGPTFLL